MPAGRPEARSEPSPWEVVVPLAGASYRLRYARELVEKGKARRTLTTLTDPLCVAERGSAEACPSGVQSTVDEALFLRHILEREGIQRATVVTSEFHWLRASTVFALVFFGSGIALELVTVPEVKPRDRPWGREIAKLIPSIGAAIIGRLWPGLYRWINRQRAADWNLTGYPYD